MTCRLSWGPIGNCKSTIGNVLLLFFINIDVFSVDDVVVSTAGGATGRCARGRRLIGRLFATGGTGLLIERFGHLVRNRLERIERVVQALNSAFFQSLLGIGDRGFHVTSNRADLLAILV